MKVCRVDLYDFKVELETAEFMQLKIIAERAELELDNTLADVIEVGLDIVAQDGL